MRIEIMIDKQQKVSQKTIEALELEIIKTLQPQYPKWLSESVKAVRTASSCQD